MSNVVDTNTPQFIATYMLRYYDHLGEGMAQLAANAPEPLRDFVVALPPHVLRSMVPEALRLIAGSRKRPAAPGRDVALGWLLARPAMDARVNALLTGRTPPTTLTDLLTRTWNAEFSEVFDLVNKFVEEYK